MTSDSKHPYPCPLCGTPVEPEELTWTDDEDTPCCFQCRAESESCGCSDE